jgi:CrcB protein
VRPLIVFLAGGLGCVSRYAIGMWIGPRPFPFGTLTVNVVGSLLIAFVFEIAKLRAGAFSTNVQLALTTGFMGGFTTYSSFNYETTNLATQGRWGYAALNVGVTLVACVLAGLAGLWLARRLT